MKAFIAAAVFFVLMLAVSGLVFGGLSRSASVAFSTEGVRLDDNGAVEGNPAFAPPS